MRTLAVMLVLVLTGCATRDATDTGLKAVGDLWGACVRHAIIRMDDGKSDPAGMAYRIEPACSDLYEKVIQTSLEGTQSVATQGSLRSTYKDDEPKLIVSAILTYRKAHSRQSNPIPVDEMSSFKEATVAYEHGDYATAMQVFVTLARLGDAEAQMTLGMVYAEGGESVPKDNVEAVKWWRMAANQGNPAGQRILGFLYEAGFGVKRNDAEAARWYRKAAEQGDAEAQISLGRLYEMGLGVGQSYAAAAKWYRMAASQGNAKGQLRLGILFNEGKGMKQDNAEAAKWYRLAAEQGDGTAQMSLARLYYGGSGVPQDYMQAYKWATLAVARLTASDGDTARMRGLGMKICDEAAASMTPAQSAEAKMQVTHWRRVPPGK